MTTKPLTDRPRILHNWISLCGTVVAVGSFFAFLLLYAIDTFAHDGNPYMGILAYVVAPGFLILGLALIGGGAWIQARHLRKAGAKSHPLTINLARPRDRKFLFVFALGAIVFLLLTALGSYETYHFTESVEFCGLTCHAPMKPEYTTYLHSPHARVACAECHVGDGATAYVKAKMNGVHQLVGVLTGEYDRPIKTPVKNLRPAQETCEQCHWPNRYVGNKDRTYPHFLMDETNTPFTVRLSLKVGGGDTGHGPGGGIHWHMNLDNKVEYITTDERRQVIPWVRMTDATGKVTEYRTAGFTNNIAEYAIRTMDCMDCHNRPAHQFLPPNDAVDLAMSMGRIDPSMPWVKTNVVAVLSDKYETEPEALSKIRKTLGEKYPAHPKLNELVAVTQGIFTNNFFPEMKADWRAYPDNSGHKNWAGCFRCHDGQHKASAGGKEMIPANDCNACHTILAQGSGEELEKISSKGHKFFHIDSNMEDFSCMECHTGGIMKE